MRREVVSVITDQIMTGTLSVVSGEASRAQMKGVSEARPGSIFAWQAAPAPFDIVGLKKSAVDSLVARYGADPTAFHAGMQRIYGSFYDAAKMEDVIARLELGDDSQLPVNIQFVDGSLISSFDAAYIGEDGGTILLSKALLSRPRQLQQVFNEEFLGHALTSLVAGRPWASTQLGDEGEALARWLSGGMLEGVLATTQGQRDLGWVTLPADGGVQRVQARLYTDMSRRWETQGTFHTEQWATRAEAVINARVDQALIARYEDKTLADGTKVTTLEQVRTYIEEQVAGSEPREGAAAAVRELLDKARAGESPGGARIWKNELKAAWEKAVEAMEGDAEGKPVTEAEAKLFRQLMGADMSRGARSLLREILGERIPSLLAPEGTGDAAVEVRELIEQAKSAGSPGGGRIWKYEMDAIWQRAVETVGAATPDQPISAAEAQLFHELLSADLSRSARAMLTEIIEKRIPELLVPITGTYEEVRAELERDITGADWPAALDAEAQQLAHQALAATMLVRLTKAKILDETTTLSATLPADVQSVVDADAGLRGQGITTYGHLLEKLAIDADANGRRDVDAFALQRLLPGNTQQTIVRALLAKIPQAEMTEGLAAIGYTGTVPDAAWSSLRLVAPTGFGLRGLSVIDKTQQQFLLRTGGIFRDVNEDGAVDDDDTVHYLDADGTVKEVRYADLDASLKKMVRFNIIMGDVAVAYDSSYNRILFPNYNSSTRESKPERVNEDFWKIDETSSGSTSWVLKEGVLPSAAMPDSFTGNGGKYTTECAHARTMMRLYALQLYYDQEFGEGEGVFRYNALFAKDTASRDKAEQYLAAWTAYESANADKSWADFAAENAAPELEYAVIVSRHQIYGHGESQLRVWRQVQGESASGSTGYFHNKSVSPLGVKIGYIGENVIDMGYLDGSRRYWGHPGGIKEESRWQAELGSSRIAVKKLIQYKQYFDAGDVRHQLGKMAERVAKRADKKIAELEESKPAGWEDQVKELQDTQAWNTSLFAVRQLFADSFDPAKLEDTKKEIEANNGYDEPAAMQVLIDTLTESGKRELVAAFDKLPEAKRQIYAQQFGHDEDLTKLTDEQKMQGVAFETLVLYGNRIHPTLRKEA
ncbi:MAG: hypothetical protein V3T05_00510, partial [Myxococcota bacterium]